MVFQPILLQFVAEGREAEAENLSSLAAVTGRFLESLLQQVDFEARDHIIELKRFFYETSRASFDQKIDGMSVVKLGREILQLDFARRKQRQPLHDVSEFADIPGPIIMSQYLLGLRRHREGFAGCKPV